MATVEWRVRADEFANCNRAYGCLGQFDALPTHGFCEAATGAVLAFCGAASLIRMN